MPLQEGPRAEVTASLAEPPPAPWLYDPYNWQRAGQGRDFQFFATDDDVAELLASALPDAFAPYSLLEFGLEKLGEKRHRELAKRHPINCFSRLRNEGQWNFGIESTAITGEVDFTNVPNLSSLLAVNGLIVLHHGLETHKLGRDTTRLGLVPQIVHRFTGERHRHLEYDSIFAALKRDMRKRLKFRSMCRRPDGSMTDGRLLMTERFKYAVEKGEIETAYIPGEPV